MGPDFPAASGPFLSLVTILVPGGAVTAEPTAQVAPVTFQRMARVLSNGEDLERAQGGGCSAYPTRRYRRTTRQQGPRWWRTRPDPFAAVWDEVAACLAASPERTAKSIFAALQQRYPGLFPDVQLRTLQRRVQVWRADALLTFDDQWLQEDVLVPPVLPSPLRALSLSGRAGPPDELPLAAEGR